MGFYPPIAPSMGCALLLVSEVNFRFRYSLATFIFSSSPGLLTHLLSSYFA